jgi:hypothetical protein
MVLLLRFPMRLNKYQCHSELVVSQSAKFCHPVMPKFQNSRLCVVTLRKELRNLRIEHCYNVGYVPHVEQHQCMFMGKRITCLDPLASSSPISGEVLQWASSHQMFAPSHPV